MIQKTFTEGISLQKDGPKSKNIFTSTCDSMAGKSYCSSVYLAPKLIPKRTYYTVDETATDSDAIYGRVFSRSNNKTLYESSVSLPSTASLLKFDCDVPYYQNLELEPRLVPKEYSETINSFPKENQYAYCSSVFYDPCFTKENYIAGVKICKDREITLSGVKEECFTSSVHINIIEEDIGKVYRNGDCRPAGLMNGI